MRNCRDISALVSQGMDKKLKWRERFTISVHVLMCERCRNFQKQTLFIRKAVHHYSDELQNRFDDKS